MRLRYILWYILLMVVPALFLALMAGKSLRLEQQRLAAIAREALYERAATHADTLDLLVTETLDTLLDAFAALDIRDPSAIHAWISRQPLVRHAFHWHPLNGLLLPDPAWPTPSETDFLQRYHALFTSRTPWPIDPPTEEAAPPPPSSPLVRARQELARSVRIAPSDLESYAPP
ncbi:MAG TPA: hypothetical protein PKE55_06050, partial [Kiritimatiellia bacterium]|nr:hypothetical protein [Kiritimatiellia bacterium]